MKAKIDYSCIRIIESSSVSDIEDYRTDIIANESDTER